MPYLTIDQLQIGIYVQIDLPWVSHPFTFNSFKIKSEEQIQVMRQLGLEQVRYDPSRSAAKPRPVPATPTPTMAAKPAATLGQDDPLVLAKKARIEHLRQYREAVAKAEKALINAAQTVRHINANLLTHPGEVRAEADAFIDQLAETFLTAPDVMIHAMGGRTDTEDLFHHGLNVTLISLVMAKGLGLSTERGKTLGMGALLHDIGLRDIPSRVVRKAEPLTDAEYRLRQMHCEYGVDLGRRLGLPKAVLEIIHQHHEAMDGSGYPRGLKGDEIAPLARIVEVANRYDKLCNPLDSSTAMSPHDALSYLFAQQRAKHDPQHLRMLIRSLGVYPPGTVVHLSNGATALVTSVNPERPLKPILVVHDPEVPKEEAITLDLELEPDTNISHAIRPNQLPRATRDYLCMRKHVSYYFDDGKGRKS
ncbi:MAG: DUF3391 domain-containing protein [Gallionellaceae bacterium]|nr:DUF3391 domain-containing protein [Gallionellaceae bacterium]